MVSKLQTAIHQNNKMDVDQIFKDLVQSEEFYNENFDLISKTIEMTSLKSLDNMKTFCETINKYIKDKNEIIKFLNFVDIDESENHF